MENKTINVNHLRVVETAGNTYFGTITEAGSSVSVTGVNWDDDCDSSAQEYIKAHNVGELKTVKFSNHADYAVQELDAKEKLKMTYYIGVMASVQGKATQIIENEAFDKYVD